jgi:hypothetical protein
MQKNKNTPAGQTAAKHLPVFFIHFARDIPVLHSRVKPFVTASLFSTLPTWLYGAGSLCARQRRALQPFSARPDNRTGA